MQWGILVVVEQRVQVKPNRYRIPDILALTESAAVKPVLDEPPFLCIEILSPRGRMGETQVRIDDYLSFGVRYGWLIHPRTCRAFVYTSAGVHEAEGGILLAENPQIRVPLAELE